MHPWNAGPSYGNGSHPNRKRHWGNTLDIDVSANDNSYLQLPNSPKRPRTPETTSPVSPADFTVAHTLGAVEPPSGTETNASIRINTQSNCLQSDSGAVSPQLPWNSFSYGPSTKETTTSDLAIASNPRSGPQAMQSSAFDYNDTFLQQPNSFFDQQGSVTEPLSHINSGWSRETSELWDPQTTHFGEDEQESFNGIPLPRTNSNRVHPVWIDEESRTKTLSAAYSTYNTNLPKSEEPLKLPDQLDGTANSDLIFDAGISLTEATESMKAANSSSILVGSKNSSPRSFDTCFGSFSTLDFTARSSPHKTKEDDPVSFQECGSIVIMRHHASKSYIGLLGEKLAETIRNLNRLPDVDVKAVLLRSGTLSITAYGTQDVASTVGKILSDHDCFLQQPEATESKTTYRNPQWLGAFGPTQITAWVDTMSNLAQASTLNTEEKSMVMRLLDSATGPMSYTEVETSDKLITPLKLHQKKSLAMMVEKESGKTTDLEFPAVWHQARNDTFGTPEYINSVTDVRTKAPPKLSLGGLLADVLTPYGLVTDTGTDAYIGDGTGKESHNTGSYPEIVYHRCLPSNPYSYTFINYPKLARTGGEKHALPFKVFHGPGRNHAPLVVNNSDLVITTYETVRAEFLQSTDSYGKLSRKMSGLFSTAWFRVVLDEGNPPAAHIIRNRNTKTFHSVYALQATHRWCLTGTPIQNRIEDLGALVAFLRVSPFDSSQNFQHTFVGLVERGEHAGWERLKALVAAISLRNTKATIEEDLGLPPRCEEIHPVRLNTEERRLYDLVKRQCTKMVDSGGSPMNSFQLILRLRQICNHGQDLLPTSLREWLENAKTSLSDDTDIRAYCERCNQAMDEHNATFSGCLHQTCESCRNENANSKVQNKPICPICDDTSEDKFPRPKNATSEFFTTTPSSKVEALLERLSADRHSSGMSNEPCEKSVVFSAWTRMLDLVENGLHRQRFQFQRIDGSKDLAQRRDALRTFHDNPDCTVLLATLGTAGVGLNLTAASKVHLIEPGWNPMLEKQALDRVHRLGQTKAVVAIRYIVTGPDSVEEYIQRKQNRKMDLIAMSLGEKQVNQKQHVATIIKEFREMLKQAAAEDG